MQVPTLPYQVPYRLLKGSQNRLGGADNSNPFVEVPSSIYVLPRLSIAIYIGFLIYFALSARDAAPNLHFRLPAVILGVLVATAPLWLPFKGIGVLHPLYLLAALSFVRVALTKIRVSAIGLDFHGALPSYSPDTIYMLQVWIIMIGSLATLCTFAGFYSSRGNSARIQNERLTKMKFSPCRNDRSIPSKVQHPIFAWPFDCAMTSR